MIPSGFEIWQLSRTGVLLFSGLVLVGLVVGISQPATRWRRGTPAVVWFLCALSLAAHGLVIAVLRADPERATGTVPLPQPLAAMAPWVAVALLLLAPLLGAWLLARTVRVGFAGGVTLRQVGMHVAVAAYAIYISPWVATIVFD